MLEIIFLVLLCGYLVQTVLFLIGTKRRFPQLAEDQLPSASIIVAARNEEKNIGRCLESLAKLDYPEDKLEIILVDDKSTDSTSTIIEQFISGKPQFKLIVSGKEFGALKGKTNALANGLEIATGEVILTTDADCAVPAAWVKTIASYYTKDVAVVNGFTWQKHTGPFSGMQNLDFLYLLTVACGTINLKVPLSCIGNNMSYLKKAYDEVGGYQNLPFSVTEDFNLLMAIKALGKYSIIFPFNNAALVESLPCPDVKSLFNQKKRWAVGGLKVPLIGFTGFATSWLTHLCIILAIFCFSAPIGWMIFMKVLLDFSLLALVTNDLGIGASMKYFWAFEIYYFAYVLLLPLLVLASRRVTWKDRTY